MQLRRAANEPASPAALQSRRIDFLHPGYPGNAILLSLPALDDDGSDAAGIDFDTALAACGLIAGNRWSDGFFSSDRNGALIVERPENGILCEPRYFFQLPGPLDPPYPIVPRFSDWRFPHGDLPPLWQRWAADAALPRTGGDTTRRCVLSNYGDGLETAHLLPAAEDDWWLSNEMQRYSLTQFFSSNPIDGPANLLTLRADLHRVFDERHFCLVPKVGEVDGGRDGSQAEPAPPQLVLHVFNLTPSGQLPNLWHNRLVHPLPTTVMIECLFARFAWTIFSPRVFDMFLPSAPVPRRLLLWSGETGQWEAEDTSPEICRKIWKNTRSRSPRKRSAPTPADTAEDLLIEDGLGLFDGASFGTDTSEDHGFYDDELSPPERQQEEEPRGRSRKRRRSLELEQQDCGNGNRSLVRRKVLH
ncbi:uncharacterized protein B0H64DRAFT_388898 [Chaetomium fimeti]|uniref:HNH nuclease domain-containing protein n=1 Tax=Chaetomium fimeti TaxID=1854472 RepID=A0AAE0LVY5_9PEZI|nr:hypothetical protein B0H64DRAFT_388898 [Chaetomium fimeti]